jgi:hypothetical protein
MVSGAILAGIAALVLGMLALLPGRPGVSKANFDRIEDGMTLAEVQAIMGRLPDIVFDMPDDEIAGRTLFVWNHADSSHASIRFNGDKVTSKTFTPSTETFTDKLRRWLGMGERQPVFPPMRPAPVGK